MVPICRLPAHFSECTAFLSDQIYGFAKLYDLTVTENKDTVIINDSLETMCNCDDHSAWKFFPDCLLDLQFSKSTTRLFGEVTITLSSRSVSICDVASSMMITWERRRIARASATSCLSPELREPVGLIIISRLAMFLDSGSSLRFVKWHRCNASQHSASVCSPNGSKLLRIVPVNSETSWLTIVCEIWKVNVTKWNKLDWSYNSGTQVFQTYCCYIDTVESVEVTGRKHHCATLQFDYNTYIIFPPLGSIILSNDKANVDFPERKELSTIFVRQGKRLTGACSPNLQIWIIFLRW